MVCVSWRWQALLLSRHVVMTSHGSRSATGACADTCTHTDEAGAAGAGGEVGEGGDDSCKAGLESLEVGFDRADCETPRERFWCRRVAHLKCEFEANSLGRGNLVVEAQVDVVLAAEEPGPP